MSGQPFAKGARTPAKACTLQVAPIGAPPLGWRGAKPAPAKAGGPRLAKAGNTTVTVAPTQGRGGFRLAV